MDKIHINSITDLVRLPIPIGRGFYAECYMCKDGSVFKKFKNNWRAEKLLSSDRFEEVLSVLCSASSSSYIGPKKLVYKDEKLVGYIYEYVRGKELKEISSSTKVEDLFNGIDPLFEDIKRFTEVGIELYDTNYRNILLDNGSYHIIDLDRSTFSTITDSDDLESQNKQTVLRSIIDRVYDLTPVEEPEFCFVNVNRYLYHDNISGEVLRELVEEYKEVCKKEHPTIRDVKRKTLQNKFINTHADEVKEWI